MKSILKNALVSSSGLLLMLTALSVPANAQQTLPDCEKEGQTIKLDLSTGIGTIGSQDPHWTVAGGGTAPKAFSTNKVAPWVNPTGTSHWIQPATGGNASTNFPAGTTYTYTTTFIVHPVMYLLGGITVQGTFSADNAAELRLNGQPAAGIVCPGSTCFSGIKQFDVSAYVHPGLNTLEVKVKNEGSYTGLMVDASVVSKCVSCKR